MCDAGVSRASWKIVSQITSEPLTETTFVMMDEATGGWRRPTPTWKQVRSVWDTDCAPSPASTSANNVVPLVSSDGTPSLTATSTNDMKVDASTSKTSASAAAASEVSRSRGTDSTSSIVSHSPTAVEMVSASLVPSVRGSAWVNGQYELILDPSDPFRYGIS